MSVQEVLYGPDSIFGVCAKCQAVTSIETEQQVLCGPCVLEEARKHPSVQSALADAVRRMEGPEGLVDDPSSAVMLIRGIEPRPNGAFRVHASWVHKDRHLPGAINWAALGS